MLRFFCPDSAPRKGVDGGQKEEIAVHHFVENSPEIWRKRIDGVAQGKSLRIVPDALRNRRSQVRILSGALKKCLQISRFPGVTWIPGRTRGTAEVPGASGKVAPKGWPQAPLRRVLKRDRGTANRAG